VSVLQCQGIGRAMPSAGQGVGGAVPSDSRFTGSGLFLFELPGGHEPIGPNAPRSRVTQAAPEASPRREAEL